MLQQFREIKSKVGKKFPTLKNTMWNGCPKAEEDHEMDNRYYAHVMHVTDPIYPIICVSSYLTHLPEKNIKGIFWHEFGHLIDIMVGKNKWDKFSESRADLAIKKHFGVLIKYDDDDVEYVD